MKKYKKTNIKKKQVLTILSVAIMILASFTAVASKPVFQSASDSLPATADETASELDYEIPDYIDCSSLSKETLGELQKRSDYIKDLLIVADDYDVELPFTTAGVPLTVNGVEFTTMIFPTNMDTTGGSGNDWTCTNLAIRITIYTLLEIFFFNIVLTGGLEYIPLYLFFKGLAEEAKDEYDALGCGGGSGVQSLMSGEILEISEIYKILDNLNQNCGI